MKRRLTLSLLLGCLLVGGTLWGQGDSAVSEPPAAPAVRPPADDPAGLGLSSPRKTVARHLYYLQPETYDPALAADALYGPELTLARKQDLSRMLLEIYNAKGTFVDTANIPNDPMFVDSAYNQSRYVVFPKVYPEIYLEKYGDQWLYAQGTVQQLPALHNTIIPIGSDLLMEITPKIAQRRFLGLKIWQYQGIVIVLLIALGLYWVIDKLGALLIRRVIPRVFPKSYLDPALIPPVAKPLSVYLVLLLVREFLLPALQFPINLGSYVGTVFNFLLPVFGILVAYRLVDVVASLSRTLAGRTETTMDDQLIPLVSKTAKFVVVIFGIIFALQNLGVNVTALLAGVSIGGLALALAAQDTVKNLFGSVAIFLDRPFQVGDFIDTGTFLGVVVEVGVRSTRIRALDGAQVSIPNGRLVDMTITNHGVRTYRRYATTITVMYKTSREQIERFVEGIREIAIRHPQSKDDSVTVYFHELGSSSLNIFFAVIYEVTDHSDWLKARQEVFIEVMALAEELGVEFAFPSTSVYLESMPEKALEAEKNKA